MRKSRFPIEQIAAVLRPAESGMAVTDLIRQPGIPDLRRVDQWRLEYISLQGDDRGSLLLVGESPT